MRRAKYKLDLIPPRLLVARDFAAEQADLQALQAAQETAAVKRVREVQAALDEQVLARYATLTEAEIKSLVIDNKWFADLWRVIEGEVQRLAQQLAGRVQELDERYAQPLSALEQEAATFGAKVEGHLQRMGLIKG